MKLTLNACYSRILWVMCAGPIYSEAVSEMQIVKGPYFDYEGIAGYIETEVIFHIKDLRKFTNIWESWYDLTDTRKLHLYGLAKGLGDCK